MRKHLAFFILFFFFLSCVAQAEEQNMDALVSQGKASFSANDFETAYTIFHKAFLLNPARLDVSFHLGRAAFEKGDYEAALMAYDRILIMEPETVRVKLEIARCHMQLGAYQVAKQYFYEALDANPPKPVKDNIELFLAAIKASEKKHFLSGSLSLGLSTDNNVRSVPPGEYLFFVWSLTSEQIKDTIYSSTAALNHIYKFEDSPYSLATSVTNFNSRHNKAKDLDIRYFGISSGPSYQGSNFLAEIHASLGDVTLGFEEYVRTAGTAGSITFSYGPYMLASTSIGIEKRKYAQDADLEKDATNYAASLSPSLNFGKNRLTATFTKERENADTKYWSYDSFKWGIRYDRTLPKDINLFTNLSITHSDYDAINTGDSVKRSDKLEEISLGANKIFWKSEDKSKNISLQINWTYTNSESSIGLYTYRKKVLASLLSFGF